MDVKQAVSLATGYFRELFPQYASGSRVGGGGIRNLLTEPG